ncbi:DUF6249 domain-containing protein [Aureibaculum sp. 2210JD6-5]|uniref:DUF6249 domain-containing protein n=1 Tax=Aureibaculum sp. 2210JD6-5 TaxID=3103957 RepID=UPI002AADA567|nr:DUF6249 domain-containing protein [Aureibaculum sp. 2210JD6-5]MDY7393659.1 DUF6249 domain-containing protein [Aureibaculum sp. 2210JD6-5]
MGSEVIILPLIFGGIFGIFYLYFTTRNKERMALIEKGADAKIFTRERQRTAPVWKVLILNLALLLMGVGAGIVIGGILYSNFNVIEAVAMSGSIFLMAGTGLLIGFFLTKNLDKE